eukprot:TRINITY_DN739_c3_g1_i1.p1 TRINITY_DN739_c3_g1~~TRINITY_DN739_c3_g1_i1.p1  ORF type:complete len:403 (+),score=123.29 TRINITY_DN739_c3_g1_i1:50-1210(+)
MALSWLDTAKANTGIEEDCGVFQEFFEKKYWHELTGALLDAVNKPQWDNAPLLMELYESFITHFEMKMNLFSLAQLVQVIASKQDMATAVALLQKTSEFVLTKKHDEAYHLLKCEEAIHRLQEGTFESKRTSKDIIETSVKYLERRNASSLDLNLRANIYRAEAAVFKAEGKPDLFYKKCLLFVAHKKTDELALSVQQDIARDLGKAALLGKTIHNFGELIHHPILQTLNGSEDEWLAQLLLAYNVGEIAVFEKITTAHQQKMKDYFGEANALFLRRKLQLMALLQHLFLTPVHDRTLSFQIIHEKCRTDSIDDVEPLLLRALALDLIRGHIDQVDQVIAVTWIAARSLGKEEISDMVGHMKTWCKEVKGALDESERTLVLYETEA